MDFKLTSEYFPTGDQPEAIKQLVAGVNDGEVYQNLLGVTGSGKTFTIANLIQQTQKPTLILSHNKTLAAQLYGEFKQFFPENAVNYFVSYYDYYQPEAYVPASDTYIEKDASINEHIDQMRLSATNSIWFVFLVETSGLSFASVCFPSGKRVQLVPCPLINKEKCSVKNKIRALLKIDF